MRTSGTLIEVGAQFLYGSASGQSRGLIEFPRLTHHAVRHAGDAPSRFEVVAGKRRLRGMFADHRAALHVEWPAYGQRYWRKLTRRFNVSFRHGP